MSVVATYLNCWVFLHLQATAIVTKSFKDQHADIFKSCHVLLNTKLLDDIS